MGPSVILFYFLFFIASAPLLSHRKEHSDLHLPATLHNEGKNSRSLLYGPWFVTQSMQAS